ncbi:hypothetical protein [Dactylosporangium sp. NPDC000521]|uniref:hypothetical protein n=1 Tax=Dactylosporangium sp. NPDC000521 TaxID=3363975 RepID=UPI003683F9D7
MGLLGVGGDDGTAVGVDLATTSAFYVGGAPGTGRSNALATLAVSLLAGGTGLIVFTPRESPLHALARHAQVRLFTDPDPANDAVQAALTDLRGPAVVLVDGADLLATPAADKVLGAVATSGRDHGQSIVCAGAASALSIGLGAWLTAARRSRRGLLLSPQGRHRGRRHRRPPDLQPGPRRRPGRPRVHLGPGRHGDRRSGPPDRPPRLRGVSVGDFGESAVADEDGCKVGEGLEVRGGPVGGCW